MGDGWHYLDYYPICEFPYINSGWMNHGEPGFDDVKPDDCSITMAQAFGEGFNEYDQKCFVYAAISFVPFLVCIYFLHVNNQLKEKKKRAKHFWFIKKPNLSEKLLYLNVLMTFFTVIFASDMDGYAGRLPLYSPYFFSRTTCMGFMSATPSHLGVMLITAWITIVDGGKHKRTPTWALWLGRTQYIGQYIAEVIGGNLEYSLLPEYSGGMLSAVSYYKVRGELMVSQPYT